jgi:WD40 repeat protein
MRTFTLKQCRRIHRLYFTPDGARLLVIGGSSEYSISTAIWVDLASGAETSCVEFPDPNCYNVDPDATRLVLGGRAGYAGGDSPMRWLPLQGKAEWREIPLGDVDRVSDVTFDPSGKLLAIASSTIPPGRGRRRERHKVDVLRLPRTRVPSLLCSMKTVEEVGIVEFNADGSRLAVGARFSGANRFEVFDVKTGRRAFKFDPDVSARPCVRFLPDDRLVAAAGSKVYVLPPERGKPQFVLGGSKAHVNDVIVSRDGRQLVAAINNGTVRTWNADTGQAGPTFAWGIGGVWAVALAPDGLTCAAAGSKARIVLWDMEE